MHHLLTGTHPLLRTTRLLVGLAGYGIAIALFVRADLGLSPWDVLSQGFSVRTGIEFGLSVLILSFLIMLLWIPLRQKPGIGTLVNALTVGPVAGFALTLLPPIESFPVRIILFIAAMVLLALSSALYIGAGLGPGPRDGLMTGVTARTGWKIWKVRGSIEVIVALGGWALGGGLGVGTVIFALGIGPMIQFALRLLRVRLAGTAPVSAEERAGGQAGSEPAAETGVLRNPGTEPIVLPEPAV
ncbi:YczE/YyaS/YitT family protein [Mycetocola saprophilus]|uniref:membrane protein YczE n=1 Tax=Mycetocola saprophilus TaxID=76636 RepID=UPI003BF025E6